MLKEWIKNESFVENKGIGFCHTAKWIQIEKIYKEGKIEANSTLIKGSTEKFLYMFYGLPYYKTNFDFSHKIVAKSEIADRPVGILFKNNIKNLIRKLFPFDSGAFLAGKFNDFIGQSNNELEKYCISMPIGDEIYKCIHRYYGTIENYLYGEVNQNIDLSESEEERLINLFLSKISYSFDERNHAIEVLFDNDIHIDDTVEAFIFPKIKFNKHKSFFINIEDKYTILLYQDYSLYSPVSDSRAIKDCVMKFYEEKGVINE